MFFLFIFILKFLINNVILYRKYFATFKINKLEILNKILNILTWLSTGILGYILFSNGV